MSDPFDGVCADLARIYSVPSSKGAFFTARLTDADIQRWSAGMRISRAALYDLIAAYLARGFHDSLLDFLFCDAIVNDIHAVITHGDEKRPDLFWRVYLAFDAGEYAHAKDGKANPVETYTRPEIAKIVESLQ